MQNHESFDRLRGELLPEDELDVYESDFEMDLLVDPLEPTTIPLEVPEGPVGGVQSYLSFGCQLYLLSIFFETGMQASSKLLTEKVDLMIIIFFRMGFTAVIAVWYLWYNGVEYNIVGPPGVQLLVLWRGVLGSSNIPLFLYALKYLPLPVHTVLSFLTPLVTSGAARLFLHEQYFWQQAAWSCASFSGVFFIAKPPPFFAGDSMGDTQHRVQAVMVSLLVVFCAAGVFVTLRKIGPRVHPMCVVGNYAAWGVVISVGAMILDPSRITIPKDSETWLLLFGATLSGFIFQILMSMALQREEAGFLATFRYTQIFWALMFEYLIWHDLPDMWVVLGGALVATGVVKSTLVRHRLLAAEKASVSA